jgi:hypothetical protein
MIRKHWITGLTGLAALAVASSADGQTVGENIGANAQASWNTASNATMNLRAPGRLVRQGRNEFRELHADSIRRSRFGPVIDEEPPDLTLEQEVRIEVIETLFTNLNAALALLNNAIRAGGGLSPQIPGGGDVGDLSSLLGDIAGPAARFRR